MTESSWERSPNEDSLVDLLKIEARARAMVFRYGLESEDADDLLQQVGMIFLAKRQQIYSAEAWLLSTLRNQCLMLVRSRYRDVANRVDRVVLEEVVAAEGQPQALNDLRSDLARALQDVGERCQEVLRLRYIEGIRPVELAKRLDYKTSGIYKILQRCVAALSRSLLHLGYPR